MMLFITNVKLYIIIIIVKYYKIIINKGQALPITCHDGTEGEHMYSCTHS